MNTLTTPKLNPEIADKSKYFHQGTMLWGYGTDWRNYDEFYKGAKDLTDKQWKDIEAGWNWIEGKYTADMESQYEFANNPRK